MDRLMPSVTTLPLAVSILRLVGAPVLLLVAALGQANAFWSVLGVMLEEFLIASTLPGWSGSVPTLWHARHRAAKVAR